MSSLQAWIVLVIACWSTWQANLVIAGVIQSNLQTLPDHREKWANVAYNYIYSIQCQMLMSHRNCRKFRVTKRSDMNIYLAYHQGNSSYPEKYRLVLPRKQYESQKYLNDAIIVIDPFPKLSFGHRLFIFAIHGDLGQVECRARHGQYIGNKECLIMITKSECPNERESYKDYKRRCDTDILPLVYYANDLYTSQQLLCYSNFSGFGQCREVPLRDAIPTPKDCQNSGTCHLGRASIQAQRTLECPRQYNPTENYAILLSSGWNDQTLSVHAESNVRRMWQALTRVHRYPVNHVQTFFGHYGVIDLNGDGNHIDTARPANRDVFVKDAIKRLCQFCNVYTLFIYMNSPTMSDGSILMWDHDGHGQAENYERYSPSEIVTSLIRCRKARLIVLLIDQSYAGILVKKIRHAKLDNVAVYAASGVDDYSDGKSFTDHFLKANASSCMYNIYSATQKIMRSTFYEPFNESGKVVMSGLPCSSYVRNF